MELFMGSFASCTLPEITIKELCVPGPASLLGSALGAVDGHRRLHTVPDIGGWPRDSTHSPQLQPPGADDRSWLDKLPTVPSWVFPSDAPLVPEPLPSSAAPTEE